MPHLLAICLCATLWKLSPSLPTCFVFRPLMCKKGAVGRVRVAPEGDFVRIAVLLPCRTSRTALPTSFLPQSRKRIFLHVSLSVVVLSAQCRCPPSAAFCVDLQMLLTQNHCNMTLSKRASGLEYADVGRAVHLNTIPIVTTPLMPHNVC